KEILPDIVYQKNTEVETWDTLQDWAPASEQVFYLNQTTLAETAGTGQITFSDQLPKEQYEGYTKNIALWEKELKETGP
ncbi:MAG: hypothetical protein RR583_07405, partial [Enterococcus sp.]